MGFVIAIGVLLFGWRDSWHCIMGHLGLDAPVFRGYDSRFEIE